MKELKGRIFVIEVDTITKNMGRISSQIALLSKKYPDREFVVVSKEVLIRDEAAMNKIGWYRK